MSVNQKNILFISASFFQYEVAIVNKLKKLGANVDFFDERPSNSILTKGIIRVNSNLYKKKIQTYYQSIFEQTITKTYDYFLLIKGESVPFEFLKNFKLQHPECKMIFYAYDSVKEYPKMLELTKYFDRSLTFEPTDANEYPFEFRPLFYLETYQNQPTKSDHQFDVSFIGSAHTDRYSVGENVRGQLDKMNLKSFFFYYSPSKSVYYLKKLFDKNLQSFDIKKLSFNKLNHQEISDIYQNSFAVLDINKPFQFGLTMRTFETLASGKKLITTNPSIAKYPFFDTQNILIIDRNQIEIPAEFFQTQFKELDSKDFEMLSMESWIREIFIESNKEYWSQVLK